MAKASGKGSSPDNVIQAGDVEQHATSAPAPAPASTDALHLPEYTDQPISGMRAVIAKRLLLSKQVSKEIAAVQTG